VPPQTNRTAETSAPLDPPPWVIAPTEERNPDTVDIDLAGTLDMLRMINDEDAKVPGAVRAALPALAAAVDLATVALRDGHRIRYFGAGTSGRIAMMDAAELIPTYDIDPSQVVAHHAGGAEAVRRPIENVEDQEASGAAEAAGLQPEDVAIGLTASGRTPYVIGALRAARSRGARTILISANPDADFGAEVDVHVAAATGPEVIAGSTRMKAGTAQKMLLNAFSTALMVRRGRRPERQAPRTDRPDPGRGDRARPADLCRRRGTGRRRLPGRAGLAAGRGTHRYGAARAGRVRGRGPPGAGHRRRGGSARLRSCRLRS
jgi:N-acetylmuramic acid 6-phosphate etherase